MAMPEALKRISRRKNVTPQRRKLLKAMVKLPGASIPEICKEAGVSDRTYYRMIAEPDFAAVLPDILDYLISQQLVPLVQSTFQRALAGSAKHSELIFKIAKLIGAEEGTKILQVFNKDGEQQTRFLSDREIEALLEVKQDGHKTTKERHIRQRALSSGEGSED
jgi:ribosomal protein S13